MVPTPASLCRVSVPPHNAESLPGHSQCRYGFVHRPGDAYPAGIPRRRHHGDKVNGLTSPSVFTCDRAALLSRLRTP